MMEKNNIIYFLKKSKTKIIKMMEKNNIIYFLKKSKTKIIKMMEKNDGKNNIIYIIIYNINYD